MSTGDENIPRAVKADSETDLEKTNKNIKANELPRQVRSQDELDLLPAKFVSGNPKRPLLGRDDLGNELHYALNPLFYSVFLILTLEAMERFSFYLFNTTVFAFLTGEFGEWHPNYEDAEANSLVLTSNALTYTSPIIGAIIADWFLGDFTTTLLSTLLLYIPGCILISLTVFPKLLGPTYNSKVLIAGFLGLYPLGGGFIKSVINIFGGKQFHPILHRDLIQTYYVYFYVAINIGGLIGGVIGPIMVQHNVTIAYLLPVIFLTIGIIIYASGYFRYVHNGVGTHIVKDTFKTGGKMISSSIKSLVTPPHKRKIERPLTTTERQYRADIFRLGKCCIMSCTALLFNLVYNQISTTYILQGRVMRQEWVFNASLMSTFDSIGVLIVGFLTGTYLYPFLERRNMSLKVCHKFAIGHGFGMISVLWALLLELLIRSNPDTPISIMWQIPSYFFVAAGEIFVVSAGYEAAFVISSRRQKALSATIFLFIISAVPSYLGAALSSGFSEWFQDSTGNGNILTLSQYVETHVYLYYVVILGFVTVGVILNVIPFVVNMVQKFFEDGRLLCDEDNDDLPSSFSRKNSCSTIASQRP